MLSEICGLKISTIIPAFLGSLVYAARVGQQSWYTRAVGLVVGVITAMFLGPAAVEAAVLSGKIAAATIFLMGVAGAGLIEVVIGISKDPLGFYNRVRRGNGDK